mmetsp:Transcript_325/g.584  ORF Transcript_325/g.584 Transcript_325/m.584 type:complete len:362 (-) Transcript_325:223-1308(-)|eukprot:CAMPEP_0184693966 /NCGR_PEP_ID=MMETSP0313-20130426/2050_1 /TAXON_ID=2792 /ORGANISM="Porphyridium aerugineum, Strain SAG 1380-2" /LENGTH=361 /DNA_ID=CAMNT_0027152161 /DNA_START=198 /DNA_END=1283 /DNA_ORIENTATION=-
MAGFVSGFSGVPTASTQMKSVCGSKVAAPVVSKKSAISMVAPSTNKALKRFGGDMERMLETSAVKEYTRRGEANFKGVSIAKIRQVYKQVFGYADHLMASEKAGLTKVESEYIDGRLTTKEFVRALAMTEQYKSRFFSNRPVYQAIELNCKHFLGRNANSGAEVSKKLDLFQKAGYEAFVNSFFDDGEYDSVYDDWEVPYYRTYNFSSDKMPKPSVTAYAKFFGRIRGPVSDDKKSEGAETNRIPVNYYGTVPAPRQIFGSSTSSMALNFVGRGGGSMTPAVAKGRAFRVDVVGFSARKGSSGSPGINLNTKTGRLFGTAGRTDFLMPKSVKSYYVGYEELFPLYRMIFEQGGKVARVTQL